VGSDDPEADKACYLFVPMISANTQSREEGYFRREWNLAVPVRSTWPRIGPFCSYRHRWYFRFGSPSAGEVREVQWTKLAGGIPDKALLIVWPTFWRPAATPWTETPWLL